MDTEGTKIEIENLDGSLREFCELLVDLVEKNAEYGTATWSENTFILPGNWDQELGKVPEGAKLVLCYDNSDLAFYLGTDSTPQGKKKVQKLLRKCGLKFKTISYHAGVLF
jgi:hypothetical protein